MTEKYFVGLQLSGGILIESRVCAIARQALIEGNISIPSPKSPPHITIVPPMDSLDARSVFEVTSRLASIARCIRMFPVSFRSPTIFRHEEKYSIVWKVVVPCDALYDLYTAFYHELSKYGAMQNPHDWQPHLTIVHNVTSQTEAEFIISLIENSPPPGEHMVSAATLFVKGQRDRGWTPMECS